jgi:hypothetical protein
MPLEIAIMFDSLPEVAPEQLLPLYEWLTILSLHGIFQHRIRRSAAFSAGSGNADQSPVY